MENALLIGRSGDSGVKDEVCDSQVPFSAPVMG